MTSKPETTSVEQDSKDSHQPPASSAIVSVHNDVNDNVKQECLEIASEGTSTAAMPSLPANETALSEKTVKLDSTRNSAEDAKSSDSNEVEQDSIENKQNSDDVKQDEISNHDEELDLTISDQSKEIPNPEQNDPLPGDSKQEESVDQNPNPELPESDEPEDPFGPEVEKVYTNESEEETPREDHKAPERETPTTTERETGAAYLRSILEDRRSVHCNDGAAKFLRTIHKSADRVRILDRFRENRWAMENFDAVWSYTENPAIFEKRAVRFINILRMRSSRLDPRKEHLEFWISHLEEKGIAAYFTHLVLTSNPTKRAESAYGWLLSRILKLEKSPSARFHQQCAKEPKIARLLRDQPNDNAPEHGVDEGTSSKLCNDIADFNDPPLSKTELEWKRRKLLNADVRRYSSLIAVMDDLMNLIGLESVKRFFLDTIDQYYLATQHGVKKPQVLNTTFTGNPGVGKTVIAKLYSRLLVCLMGLSESYGLVVENGQELSYEDYSAVGSKLSALCDGVIMIDEAAELTQGSGRRVSILVGGMDKNRGSVHYVLTGPPDEIESLRAASTRFQSLLPQNIIIEDHTLAETFALLREEIKVTWDGKIKVEGGESGLFMRVAARRLAKGRGSSGFGNFHEIEKLMTNIRRRNASRIATAKDSGEVDIDVMLLTKDDLLGPPPDEGVKSCEAWKTLHDLVGLEKVKKAIQSLVERVNLNYHRELSELPMLDTNLNRLFLGNPGTGKTTVAKLYAEILAKSGVLSSSEVILKTPVDFTSEYIGRTAKRTKELLSAAKGKVLVIDEAYMMYPDSSRNVHSIHSSAIDTIVSDVQGVPGEDRAVLLLGYKDKMENMLQNGNPGLERRFPLSTAFIFEDYTRSELLDIFHTKMKKQGLSCTPEAVDVAMDLLDKAKRRPNFGNAGEVDNVLTKAKQQASLRLHDVPIEARPVNLVLKAEDFDTEYKRSETATTDIASLFQNVLECEHLVTKLQGYANTCTNLRHMGIQPTELIPFSFVFKGPPGTFKTSAARAFGQVFYDMGLLADSSVVDCSITDLVGEYCGQTGVKTRQVLDQAIGKVLLIDEAYRLVETSKFGDEAIGELIDAMTKPRYMQKMVIILAGDEEKMNNFMLTYHHLRSRFAEDITFKSLGVEQSYKLLIQSVSLGNRLPIEIGSDVAHYETKCKRSLKELISLPTWGNGRDVTDILAKRLVSRVVSKPLKVTNGQKLRLVCGGHDFHAELEKLCIERRTLSVR